MDPCEPEVRPGVWTVHKSIFVHEKPRGVNNTIMFYGFGRLFPMHIVNSFRYVIGVEIIIGNNYVPFLFTFRIYLPVRHYLT